MPLLATFVPYGYGVDDDDNDDNDDTPNGQMLRCCLLPGCPLTVAWMEERHGDEHYVFQIIVTTGKCTDQGNVAN